MTSINIQLAIIWSIAGIITIVSFLPGGLGAREFSLSYLLSVMVGIDKNIAVSLVLLHTLLNYSTTLILTIIAVLVKNIKEKRM